MSSGHYIIIARHDKTGELRLPLGDLTLYGQGIDPETKEYLDDELVRQVAKDFDDDWTICLYGRVGDTYGGAKKTAVDKTDGERAMTRQTAVSEWTRYCAAFGIEAKHLRGRRWPGLEDFPMDDALIAEVEARLSPEQSGQTILAE